MSSRIRNFGWNRLKLATLSYEEIKTLEEQVKSEHACSDGINMYDKAGRDKLDALKSKDDFGGEVVPVYTAPQPLTTSERAELENYRNTQQVVPEEIPRLHDGNKFKYVSGGIRFSSHYANGWNACRAAMLQGKAAGNSPVIPDGWVACSERMPGSDEFVHIWPRPDFGVELHVGQYLKFHKKGAGWYAQGNEQNYGIEWYPIAVTHWMPLPAAPQQEAE